MDLSNSIKACGDNGKRLLEDAECLYEMDRFASAYGLTILAQEEFAKGFILKLVDKGALKWTPEVQRSLNHHVSKQLMVIILENLSPDFDVFIETVKNRTPLDRPSKVSDAINIYVHEILRRWESANWVWNEDPEYDKAAKSVFNGLEDRKKQRAFYIRISNDGTAINSTTDFKKENTRIEIEKTKRFEDSFSLVDVVAGFHEIVKSFKLISNY